MTTSWARGRGGGGRRSGVGSRGENLKIFGRKINEKLLVLQYLCFKIAWRTMVTVCERQFEKEKGKDNNTTNKKEKVLPLTSVRSDFRRMIDLRHRH